MTVMRVLTAGRSRMTVAGTRRRRAAARQAEVPFSGQGFWLQSRIAASERLRTSEVNVGARNPRGAKTTALRPVRPRRRLGPPGDLVSLRGQGR